MDEVSGSTIIGVCGGSGSGKTTLARELARKLGWGRTAVLSFDSYYHDLAHLTTEERSTVNFDAPDSLDVELLTDHLAALRRGAEITVPIYDFASHTRSGDVDIVEATDFVVIEGILLFAFAEIRDLIDYRVYLDCPGDIRYQRRLVRDVNERGRTADSVAEQWETTVAPMHDLHVEPYAPHAHFLATYGPPAVEIAAKVALDLGRTLRPLH
ncbi:MAG: uridine kinase [Acidimicrobiia bacterium]|nr:uridine kinase [Acidimicrobiia bacterium]